MELTPVIIVPTIMYFVYKAIESLVRRKERMLMVEKLDFSNLHTLSSAEALNVMDCMPNKRFSGLRTGLLLAGVGLGLMVAWVLVMSILPSFDTSSRYWEYQRMLSVVYLAAPACFGGIGLIISYIIEQKARK